MQIRVNGKELEVASTTLSALLEELEYGGMPVATAINQNFVRAVDRSGTPIRPGDSVEIVAPRQGG